MSAVEDWLADPDATLRALDAIDARDSLAAFCQFIEIPGAPVEEQDETRDGTQTFKTQLADHHRLLIDKLEAVDRGECRRLMVFMPPGSAKSTYASVVFPVWFMGRKLRRNVIVATYASDLARKIGRRARGILRQPAYGEVFNTGLSADSAAADEWALTNENEFMGGGILSGITGNRADLIIIDDPIKGRQQADSQTIRETTKSAYDDDVKTRLKPGGRIVLIQTRWHEDDLAGSLLPEDYDGESGPILCRDGEVWEVLCIPAQAVSRDDPLGRQVGEYLWPEWFPPDHWRSFQSVARTWSALYQQRPRPADGTFFQKEWFKRYVPQQLPQNLTRYITSDHAPGGQEDSDYSCVRVWGIDPAGDIWLLDGFRHQATMDKTADKLIGNLKVRDIPAGEARVTGLIARYKPHAWFPEDDNNWKSAEGFIRRRMREELVHCRIEPISPHGSDKAAKAQAFQAMASSGRVHLPIGPEGDDVLDQYLAFPMGKNDDEVDAAGIIGRAIDMAHPAIVKLQVVNDQPMDVYARARRAAREADGGSVHAL